MASSSTGEQWCQSLQTVSGVVSPASLRPVGTGFTGPTAPDIKTPNHVFHAGLRRGYRTDKIGTRKMKEGERGLLMWAL